MSCIREAIELREKEILSSRATFSCESKGRKVFEEPCELRTDFQRDRDRIIHSKAFRRLKHKTQVFLSPESDHYRTRLTHTLEVSQIARTVARALNLNEDLTEAIALAHDLGHTPFGHAGERALKEHCEGFTHYEQSVRVCEKLERGGKGLNLTAEVLDGILHHTCGDWANTPEGKIVRYCDRIAYINHDIDDAVRANVISANDIPADIIDYFGNSKSARINSMVRSLVSNSQEDICMDETTLCYYNKLHEFLFESVYRNPKAKAEEDKVYGIVDGLFKYFSEHTEKLSAEYLAICETEGVSRAVTDYIAGMTDQYAVMCYTDAFIPKFWNT